ncbi:carboxy-S-adenosyl-L-methionine synthase CmoA [Helicobacter trogontum]|uniref:Carboxy-S-adenosyl-L-methionine synthase n=1 Tax=Helicobacter trogontum TaxID=50960 RepID=A0A4U8SBY8_9HELI|nr:carboxy-S-adenosyl-L-methionine synthase CmoA [Helicobacter trogontum]TLD83589.1 carboxy-S-adenosyl-L-methionine synthase CmoA [Helicobacter trogontum]
MKSKYTDSKKIDEKDSRQNILSNATTNHIKCDRAPNLDSTHNTDGTLKEAACVKKDEIFLQDSMQIMPKFEFNEIVASVFDDMLERSIPFYDEVMNLSIFFIQQYLQTYTQQAKEEPVIYDLGSSTGNLLLKLAASLEKQKISAHLYGIDSALAMIERAQLKSAAMGFNIDFLQADFLTFDFKPTHVFLAFYTMQFVRPLQRKDMIQKIYDSLYDDGIFLFAEKVISDDSRLEGQMIECYYDYKAKQGYTHKEIYKKREALENVLVPYSVKENYTMLQSCGFRHIEILFKWVNFTLFLARK